MGLAGQVIDILIDNALRHGDGAVTLMIDGPSVVVIDQGKGMSTERSRTVFDGPVDPAAQARPGLALARRLAQVDGGSLDVVGQPAATDQVPARARRSPTGRRPEFCPHGRVETDEPGRKTNRRLQEAGALETASGRKQEQYCALLCDARSQWSNFLQNLRSRNVRSRVMARCYDDVESSRRSTRRSERSNRDRRALVGLALEDQHRRPVADLALDHPLRAAGRRTPGRSPRGPAAPSPRR